MQRLESVMFGPYSGYLIADFFRTGHAALNLAPLLTSKITEILELNYNIFFSKSVASRFQ